MAVHGRHRSWRQRICAQLFRQRIVALAAVAAAADRFAMAQEVEFRMSRLRIDCHQTPSPFKQPFHFAPQRFQFQDRQAGTRSQGGDGRAQSRTLR